MRIQDMASEVLANSRRWFPHIYARDFDFQVMHMGMGVAGEGGEVINKIKKATSYTVATLSREQCDAIAEELTDVLCYTLGLLELMGYDAEEEYRKKVAICNERWG